MVKHLNGNLLDAQVDVIFHGCNCFCAMGLGIAPQIAKAHPAAREVDYATTRGDKTKLGSFTKANSSGLTVYNLYTQYTPGKDFRLEALLESMQAMREDLTRHPKWGNGLTIAGPRIGCGIGGGTWSDVEQVINLVFPDVEVLIYTYEPPR